MNINNQLDSLDIEILRKLTKDARIAYSQLAKNLKISNSLVHQRINRLKKLGVLKNAHFEIDPSTLGYTTVASTGIVLKESRYVDQVVQALKQIPEVVECLNVTGKFALQIKTYAFNNDHFRSILYEKIHTIKGIEETDTSIAFNKGFSRNVPLVLK
jgi:Lrp/AsnC family transcriptional regulator, regulator for asnA, asnC and gidA